MNDVQDIEVQLRTLNGACVLKPVGDIDLSHAPSLRTHLTQALRGRPSRLIVDLEEVPYMDSSGVATFVEAMQRARRGETQLILCNLQERVRSIFEIARLDMVFKLVGSVDEALALT